MQTTSVSSLCSICNCHLLTPFICVDGLFYCSISNLTDATEGVVNAYIEAYKTILLLLELLVNLLAVISLF